MKILIDENVQLKPVHSLYLLICDLTCCHSVDPSLVFVNVW